MKIKIATPTCQACKHFRESRVKGEQTCFHPDRPQGNDHPEPYMLNCHGVGFEWGDWNTLSVEIDVSEEIAEQIYNSTNRYREIKGELK